jgi:predicted DNA-binding transcriptional regulator AlpA
MRFLSKKQVREITTLSPAHTARLEEEGKFPRRHRLTDHPNGRVAYVESEIEAWMETRLNQKPR